jgi:CRP/FNR family cyclic AMP-dependent transcriptional regulator
VGSQAETRDLCCVLVEDPDLADAIPGERRHQAVERSLVPAFSVPTGPWCPPKVFAADGIGFLVLAGVLIRRVEIGERCGAELVGESDVMRPWQGDDAQTLPLSDGWSVLEPTRLAVLDGSFTRLAGEFPELAGKLFERSVRRSRRLAANMAIIHQARVDDRLHMLFWHLANRWGRVRADGTLVPLRLTHTVLADLVAARRPTVSSALAKLSRRGLVRAVDDGWLLAGEAPRGPQSLTEARPVRPDRPAG